MLHSWLVYYQKHSLGNTGIVAFLCVTANQLTSLKTLNMGNTAVKIFWADDDKDDVAIIGDALSEVQTNVSCLFFENGMELINALNSKKFAAPPEFIVLDINMPLMDGLETLGILRQNPVYRDIPIIICSTSLRQIETSRMNFAGANEYIVKPSCFREFVTMVAHLVKTYGAKTAHYTQKGPS